MTSNVSRPSENPVANAMAQALVAIPAAEPGRCVPLWLATVTKIGAGLTLSLLVAGALVTSMKAALSDPTWPTFVGRPFPTKDTFVGGLVFEDSHRILASLTGLWTLLQAGLLTAYEPRRGVRRWGWFAVVLVVIQALLGGLVIHSLRSPWVSVFHGVVGQTYLVTMMGLALATSRWWHVAAERSAEPGLASLRRQLAIAAALVFLQLILGAGLRHSPTGFTLHLVFHVFGAIVVASTLVFLAIRAAAQFGHVAELRRGLVAASVLVFLQMLLGIAAVFANRARPEPEVARWHHVGVSVGHVALGAVLLALTVCLALAARRLAPPLSSTRNTESSS